MCLYEMETKYPIIEIHVSCNDLSNLDLTSKTDSLCLYETEQNGKYIEEDRTEIIFNNPNPHYVKSFMMYDIPDSNQQIRFSVYDYDGKRQRHLELTDQIGYILTDSRYISSHLNSPMTFDLKKDTKKGKRGQITLLAHSFKQSRSYLRCIIQVTELKKMKTFAKNNPFFEISKPFSNGQFIHLYRSEAWMKCYSCTFNELIIPINSSSKSDSEHITFSFYDYNQKKPPKMIGQYTSTVRDIMNSKNSTFDLKDEKGQKNTGQFKFTKIEAIQIPTFQDYLKSGIKLKLMAAIDLTSSNKYIHNIPSDPKQTNLCQQCIVSVVNALTKYVSNNSIPVYGFGAKYENQDTYIFPLTLDMAKPEVNGLQGILDAYKCAIQKVKLGCDSKLAPIIKEAKEIAIRDFNKNKNYTILVIITELLFNDVGESIDAVVEASDAPLSIIIVSIWNKPEKNARMLEAAQKPLVSSTGECMKRGIVKFASFYHFKEYRKERIEMDLLKEVPKQLHQYCEQHGFIPKMND